MDQRSSGSNQYVQQQRPRGQYNWFIELMNEQSWSFNEFWQALAYETRITTINLKINLSSLNHF